LPLVRLAWLVELRRVTLSMESMEAAAQWGMAAMTNALRMRQRDRAVATGGGTTLFMGFSRLLGQNEISFARSPAMWDYTPYRGVRWKRPVQSGNWKAQISVEIMSRV
jgi:hypothetical protein